jgi:hypothetical protein
MHLPRASSHEGSGRRSSCYPRGRWRLLRFIKAELLEHFLVFLEHSHAVKQFLNYERFSIFFIVRSNPALDIELVELQHRDGGVGFILYL